MLEYTVHFQKGSRVGARRLRMVHVQAANVDAAVRLARAEFHENGYRIMRVDHFDEDNHLVVDM